MEFLGLESGRGITPALVYLQQGTRRRPQSFLCSFATVNVCVDLNGTLYFMGKDLMRDSS